MVCGVDAAGKFDVFRVSDLARTRQTTPGRPRAWGPRQVGNRVMLATDSGQLYCFDAAGNSFGKRPCPTARWRAPRWRPAITIFPAAAAAWCRRVDGRSGKPLARISTGQPLATGPVLMGDRLLLGGHDGSLHQLTPP